MIGEHEYRHIFAQSLKYSAIYQMLKNGGINYVNKMGIWRQFLQFIVVKKIKIIIG